MSEHSLNNGEEASPFLPQTVTRSTQKMPSADRLILSNSRRDPSSMPTRKLIRLAKICATVTVLALVFIVAFALISHRPISHVITSPFSDYRTELSLKNIYINKLGNLVFTDRHTSVGAYLSISFPYRLKSQSDDTQNKKCPFSNFSLKPRSAIKDDHVIYEYQQSCFEFDNHLLKAAVYETDVLKGAECYVVHWFSERENSSIENCIDMSSDNWYGGGTLAVHRWPLNRAHVVMQPFITKKFSKTLLSLTENEKYNHFSSFIEPYFLSAQGVAILFDHKLPLFVSVITNKNDNDERICFKSAFDKPFDVESSQQGGIHLNYTVCKDLSAKAIHEQMLKFGNIQHPKEAPRLDLLQKPVWSTRGQDILNETKLLAFVNNIKGFSLNFSQLFIDGNYTKSPGGLFFDEKRFPHSAQIIMELDEKIPEKNLKVGTEVHPIVPYYISNKQDLSVQSGIQQLDHTTDPLLLDVSKEKAREWFKSQLDDVHQQLHVSGFRFSGGETASFLKHGGIKTLAYNFSVNEITTKYASVAAMFKDSSFMGSGYKSQVHGLIADAGPFFSTWDHQKGLKSVIPVAITLGLIGYPFVSAGPVGGINYDKVTGQFSLPKVDLYLRWLQISIFLPVVEFSIGPWEYGPKVVKFAKALLDYRQKILWPQYLSAAVKEAVDVGTPIIRPLWWIAAHDFHAQFIDCEFLVSNSLLVAPVLFEDHTRRDIYLPDGSWWKDMLRGKLYKGGQWLHGYTVGQFEIATFVQTGAPKSKS